MALVQSKHTGILHIGAGQEKHEVTLMPGVNKVPDEAWLEAVKAAEKLPALKHYFDEGIVEELKGKKAEEFGKLPVAEAKKLVKATNVEALLKEFRRTEQKTSARTEVLDAIEEQIKALQPEAGSEKPKDPASDPKK